jgi:hypothetical protein
MRRRPLIHAFAATALAAAGLSGPLRAAPGASVRTITWDDLVPGDWDPSKRFLELNRNLGLLNDADPRAVKAMKEMRELWDNAPTVPAMNGSLVKLPGYIVPLEEVKGELKEFLLVPYFGACIHTPPPPANQIVHVVMTQPARGYRSMEAVWISGTLSIERRADASMGTSGYRMLAGAIERYVPTSAR